ncbi:disintegrin and metalloproteinase domain-containing protein 9 [Orycteropus afer afer]|uniref:Disintegrin and metalloproteinase domain-containing protein 9 n=1 Tax=Orycteropus afer afer TaxID=1230840 RepID=A0A8B6ZC77_ORYAF|nr:disintegrin and metalloproteinase domain-containing protein 9 [Orycteropus afer afer]
MGSGVGSSCEILSFQWLLLFGLLGPVLGGAQRGFQQTTHLSSYEIITPWRLTRERREAPRPNSKQVSYVIQAEGREHIIHLERNKDLLPKDFVVYTYNKEGALISDHPDIQNHCHYRGYVEGVYNSSVALSNCFGLRGLLHLDDVSYGIEPLQNSTLFEHIFYRMDDVNKEPLKCGVSNKDVEKQITKDEEEESPNMTKLLRRRRAILPQTRYVELFIVVDKEKYDTMGRNQTAVREEMIRLANYLDSALRKKGFGGTAGMAFVGTVCSRSHAGGINVFGQITVETFASIVAHELGHNLGMNHDDGRDCFCGAKSCIMNSGASISLPPVHKTPFFEVYSGHHIAKSNNDFSSLLLLDLLAASDAECELDPCCEARTCKLQSGAECAYGDCCKNCLFLPGGTLCRGKSSECDVPEYCNGSSQFCQPDVFIQNGYPCQNNKAYCYNGMCQYYDAQCQVIFGSKAKAAPRDCFIDVNSKGDRFGNCGFSGNEYKKCATGNALCGKLQCENVQGMSIFGVVPAIIQTHHRGTTCWGVDFQLGSDVPDPGMVNEGTKCNVGKICRNFQCVNASVLNYDCDIQKKCYGHGVCNSNKNCHCENGWAPPNCETKGYGGSVDSGPTYNEKNTSLRDGLLVFFFLIVPLIAFAAFVFIKRDQLQKRCFRKKRSQTYESHDKNQGNDSRQPVSAPRFVSPVIPPREAPVYANRFPVPTYAVKQPQQFPSRPPPPQPKVSSQGNLIPARRAPAPPLYSSLT